MASRKFFTDTECRQFGEALRNKIKEKGITVTAAAKILGVTRQALYFHFGGIHQPRRRVVERAVRTWDMVVYAQSQRFDRKAFGSDVAQEQVKKESAVQLLLLPEALERLENSNLEARVVRSEANRLYLELLVKFAG